MNKMYQVAIIGGGPSGIMAALTAAQKNESIILIEKNETLGRKILATGNGRCNITNRLANALRYHGGDSYFVKEVLSKFNQFAAMKYFEDLGIVLKEEDNGRIFPQCNQAQTVVNALVDKLIESRVQVKTSSVAKKINRENNQFQITLINGEEIVAEKLIISTGGVDLRDIDSKTLQSRIVKNLYFAGEVLDVDGDSGGFNLQWAWSSGHLAGQTL